MNDLLYEPLKFYDQVGKAAHTTNAEEFFDDLLGKSGVNAEENRQTVADYNAENETIQGLSKIIKKFKGFKTWLIIGIVLSAFAIFSGVLSFGDSVLTGILLAVGGVGFMVLFIMLLAKKVTPVIKDTSRVRAEHEEKAKELLATAWEQMAPLNALFSDDDTLRLIEKTIPEFTFDNKFTKEQQRLFMQAYDFVDLMDSESSVFVTFSGKFAGNPFVFVRRKVHRMGTHTYTGSLTITWTETYRDSSGNLCTRQKTETLHASVTKPKPNFSFNTFLAYGSQAAPDLSFSRSSSHAENLSERALEKKIKKGEKELQKQAKKALKKGENFQEMANSEFDVLFGANDRDHEVQFRLMYTPLAQRNTVALIKDKDHYGDDFDFVKRKRFNVIMSDHAQHWYTSTSASNYHSYDVDDAKKKFVTHNDAFFKSIFFDFAPLLSVPAYTDEPCAAMEDLEEYDYNYTSYEHEAVVNAAGYSSFVHDSSNTEAIIKTRFLGKTQNSDNVEVTAYSYATFERIDYIPVKGGDGNYHNVPVPWIEYVPVSKSTCVEIAETETDSLYHGMTLFKLQ